MSFTPIPNSTSSNMPMPVQSWEYQPTDESLQMLTNKKMLFHIKSIASKLPKLSLISEKELDYPRINASALSNVGIDYHIDREVFVLGGHAFFRRYNDDWNGILMRNTGQHNGHVAWGLSVSINFLVALDNLLDTRKPDSITFDEISALIKLK
jgi:hypothetical protein